MWTLNLSSMGESGKAPAGFGHCGVDMDDRLFLAEWTGTRAGSIQSPDLFRIPLLPSINDNVKRVKHFGIDPLASKVMSGIVMNGFMPTFYRILVAPELVSAVESGERPEQDTVVHA